MLTFPAQAQTLRTVGPFDVYFYDSGQADELGSGIQNWTNPQIDDVISCLVTWTNRITNTPGRQVKLHLFWENLGSSILGETSNPLVGDYTNAWTFTERVWRFGDDFSTTKTYDARIAFSTGISWNFGSATPSSGYYDFRSVFTHEIGHTLGFASTYQSGSDYFSNVGVTVWDTKLRDDAGNAPLANSSGTPGNFNQLDNPVWFTGANAVTYYHNNYDPNTSVPVYAPASYESGSSLTHLNESTLPNALMSPVISSGTAIRAPTPLEWEIIKDLTWTTVGINTWTKGGGTLNWGTATNWSSGSLPDSTYNVSFSNSGLSNGDTINLGANRTINALTIDSNTNFSIGGASGTLTLNSGYITRSTISTGTQTIARPLSISPSTVWDISGSGALRVSNTLSAANSLTKVGTGMVTLAGSTTISGTLNIDDGDWTLASGGSLTVNNISGLLGSLNFDGGALNLTGTNNLHLYGVRVGKDGVGSFTLASGKSITADIFLTIGRDSGGQGTFINQGAVNASTNLFVGANSGSWGHYVQQSGATTSVVNVTYVGYESGSAGVMEINGGTYTSPYLVSGYNGTGTLTISGGTINSSSATIVGYGSTGSGLLQISGGTLTTFNLYPGYGGPGAFTQSNGTVTVTGTTQIAYNAQGTYNLNGGTLIIKNLYLGSGTAAFNIGAGTLRAAASFSTDVPITLTGTGGNANIDTQSNNVTLSGYISGNGGLNKLGAGTLTIADTADYLGATTISAGKLAVTGSLSDLHAITGSGSLAVGTDSTSTILYADSVNINRLSIGAGSTLVIRGSTEELLSPLSDITTIPEPSIHILLLLAGLWVVLFRPRRILQV